jgi:hypothetical protein
VESPFWRLRLVMLLVASPCVHTVVNNQQYYQGCYLIVSGSFAALGCYLIVAVSSALGLERLVWGLSLCSKRRVGCCVKRLARGPVWTLLVLVIIAWSDETWPPRRRRFDC